MTVCAAAELAELPGVVLEPDAAPLELLLELHAAMSVAAAAAASVAVAAREGPTPKRLRKLMGTS
jgi:hypothetical protein